MTNKLPLPSAEQLSRSAELTALVVDRIVERGGWIGFDEYMGLALYTPELGYYTNTQSPFSLWAHEGDFVTAPLLTPLFGQCLAEQALEVFELTGQARILEFGAGTGRLAADVLRYLADVGVAVSYDILEVSATLRSQQRAEIESALSGVVHGHCVRWLDALPESFEGLMLGNEVLDAMPVRLIGMAQGVWFERGVSVCDGALVWSERPVDDVRLPVDEVWAQALAQSQTRYVSEIHAQQSAFIQSLGHVLRRGVILMVDYGFPAHEYYHPERNTGTMMCHIQHVAHDNALYVPGVQDITAHVNFSALLGDVGVGDVQGEGLRAIGFTSQANFLINLGVLDLLSGTPVAQQRAHANRVQKLLSEAEMGELFKVMAWSRGLDFAADETLLGFCRGDRLDRL